jgi:hypothetical protein
MAALLPPRLCQKHFLSFHFRTILIFFSLSPIIAERSILLLLYQFPEPYELLPVLISIPHIFLHADDGLLGDRLTQRFVYFR